MKQYNLQNGDIVVFRDGCLGIYIEKKDCGFIVYQFGGYCTMDFFEDDMSTSIDGPEADIMQVYREECSYGAITFCDYDDGELIFERDETWVNPDLESKKIEREKECKKWKEISESIPPEDRSITILSQAFCGNRTTTMVKRENIDSFILGCLSPELFDPEHENIDRTMIPVPGTDNIVIIYNKFQEEENLEIVKNFHDDFFNPPKALVVIPENGITLYSRCIVCRCDKNGILQSLESEDYSKFMKYMAK